jgi:hypothetical protein
LRERLVRVALVKHRGHEHHAVRAELPHVARVTRRFSSPDIGWFSPSDPKKISPLMPDLMSTYTCAAVPSRSMEPSLWSRVVIAEKTPDQ